jgi:hypothetical protein
MAGPYLLQNALIWSPDKTAGAPHACTLRPQPLLTGGRPATASARSIEIDLTGLSLLPALTNHHDHLELNHYPRTRFREVYPNAHEWGEEVNARLNDPPFRELRAYPLADRCFIGGLKNLLCGALKVIQHGPPHRPLFAPDFPVQVARRYGWAHSLRFDRAADVIRSYRRTPPDVPWFIHLAEGTDPVAAGELDRLAAMGCLGDNTVIVHGVGVRPDCPDQISRVKRRVWCPTTNIYLLGRQLPAAIWPALIDNGGPIDRNLIGSDSRLTAEGDLLDEMRALADGNHGLPPHTAREILAAVGLDHAAFPRQFRRDDDWIAVRAVANPEAALCRSRRADLALILRRGVPQIGDPDVMLRFPSLTTIEAALDGRPKRINVRLARQIARCSLKEPGLDLLENPFAGRRIVWTRKEK